MDEIMEVTPAAAPLPAVQAANPAQLLQIAVQQNADLDKLERLMALQERWEADQARRTYFAAMSAFKAEPMTIFKRKEVSFTTRDGDTTSYKHAELSDITAVVDPLMGKHGLAYKWQEVVESGIVKCRCIVRHATGHEEPGEWLPGPLDNSGKKNAIQQMASTITYLRRYTLLGVLGMSTKGDDNDGADGADGVDPAEQARNEWIAAAKSAPDRAELGKVAKAGAKAFQQAKDRYGYAEFAKAVQARGAELGGPEGGAA